MTTPQVSSALHQIPLTLLEERARQMRLWILDMIYLSSSSHIGSCYSMVDILTVLYSLHLDVESIAQQRYPRDYFILSKGHAVPGLYAALASVGIIQAEELKTYYQDGSRLPGHPVKDKCPGVEVSTGSLGHGVCLAAGIALGLKLDGHHNKVVTIVGDGECQEGSVWEAIDSAVRFQLTNFTIIVDHNNLQGFGRNDEISVVPPRKKFEGFGCNVIEVDGHDMMSIHEALNKPLASPAPRVIVAHTIKGKGVLYMEDKLEWHYKSPKGDLYERAKKELEQR